MHRRTIPHIVAPSSIPKLTLTPYTQEENKKITDAAKICYEEAQLLFKEKKCDQAIQKYHEALKNYSMLNAPSDTFAYCYMSLADAYDQSNNIDEALKYYKKAREIYSTDIDADYFLAKINSRISSIYFKKNKYRKAIKYATDALDSYKEKFGENSEHCSQC